MIFTDAELVAAIPWLVGSVPVLAVTSAYYFWQQARDIRELDRDLQRLWNALYGDEHTDGPDEPTTAPIKLPANPDTVEAHPADTFARQQYVAAQKVGRHRR